MDFDHENVRSDINEDRLSSLPDDLIHQILSCNDIKFAVQTCLLSSRWKLLWTSMPCLNFSSRHFGSLPKFAEFVTHVLSHRNHQIEVTSVKLSFHGEASQAFVRKITSYAFSHNVQELTVVSFPRNHHEFPPCLFSSPSLKHFTLSCNFHVLCLAPKTPWDFPALTSLRLDAVRFCDDNTRKSVDLFSKCVNLKNLTLESFVVETVEGFDIITPRLSNLTLIKGRCLQVINLIAPQLENLTVIDCSIKYLNAPPGLSSLYYRGYCFSPLSKDRLHSLNKATIWLSIYCSNMPYKEEDARKTINMLQEVQSARFLTLNADIVECISSFPDLLSLHPSPFSNLICLNIDSSMRKDAYKVKISTEARNFLLENSPSATFIMALPEAPPTKAMQQKEARAKKKAKLAAEIESHMMELRTSLEQGKLHFETKQRFKLGFEDLMVRLQALTKMQIESERTLIEQVKESAEILKAGMQMQVYEREIIGTGIRAQLVTQIEACAGVLRALLKQECEESEFIFSRKFVVGLLLDNLPKRQRTEIEACYSRLLQESEARSVHLISERDASCQIIDAYEKFLSYMAS
ncbi:F-box domain, cyclin-like protein [Cynara cardunculus var. scolymus]|uniref:F-box domain, cyclin-like protein n=1 Tax=Cynara cardunculus var. scolymus TaxID=59895 RepID=A0A118JX28_CYNCS|nr:F-box domain, cyclin-like protein [Cynara cardunculus var. scolymus]